MHTFKTDACSILDVIICLPFSLIAYAIPLIAVSIMSKKIASGADKILIDIKLGNHSYRVLNRCYV